MGTILGAACEISERVHLPPTDVVDNRREATPSVATIVVLFLEKDHVATLINTIQRALRHRYPCRRETEMSNTPNRSTHAAYPWQTKTFAARNHIEEQTARKRYSQTGSYFGVTPQKLANGRLAWPSVIATKRGPVAANDEAITSKDGLQ